MGDLSDPANTFWELFLARSGFAALVSDDPARRRRQRRPHRVRVWRRRLGRCRAERPSALLPWAQRDGGSTWVPVFLPGGLAPLPGRARHGSPGSGPRSPWGGALRRTRRLSSWTPLVTAADAEPGFAGLRRERARRCRAPLQRGAVDRHGASGVDLGLFTRTATTWQGAGPTGRGTGGSHHRAAGAVDGGGDDGARPTRAGCRRALVALWQRGRRMVGRATVGLIPGTASSTAVQTPGDRFCPVQAARTWPGRRAGWTLDQPAPRR